VFYETKMSHLKEALEERWDSQGKTFKCDTGTATIRTTRSLEIKNKVALIALLQKLDKLSDCIKGWDLLYLRKLADVGLIEPTIAEYKEQKNAIIGGITK